MDCPPKYRPYEGICYNPQTGYGLHVGRGSKGDSDYYGGYTQDSVYTEPAPVYQPQPVQTRTETAGPLPKIDLTPYREWGGAVFVFALLIAVGYFLFWLNRRARQGGGEHYGR